MSIFAFQIAVFGAVLLFITTSFAQTDRQVEYDTIYSKRKIKLVRRDAKALEYTKGNIEWYVSPFALLEPCPTIYLGGEYFIKKDFSIYTDLGYMANITGAKLNTEIDPFLVTQDDGINPNILNSSKANYVIKSELRWYRKYSNPQDAFYYGLRFMWRNTNYLKGQQVYEEYSFSTLTNNWTGIGDERVSIYQVRRRSVGVQFLIGWKDYLFNKVSSNWYVGVGVRYISNVPTNKVFDPFEDFDSTFGDLNLEFLELEKQYKFITMDLAIGMRFGGKIR